MNKSGTNSPLKSLFDVVCFTGGRDGAWPEARFIRLNSILGIAGEAGEVSSARRALREVSGLRGYWRFFMSAVRSPRGMCIRAHHESLRQARYHLASECGDVLWYVAYLLMAESGPVGREEATARLDGLLGSQTATATTTAELRALGEQTVPMLFEGAAAAADEIKKNECHHRPLRTEVMDGALAQVIEGLCGVLVENGLSVSDACEAVSAKLRKRYPNGFTTAASVERNDETGT